MRIEVAVKKDASTKERGDLLENLAAKLLRAQGYEVIQEIRMTAVELDLLCRHTVSRKEIYVECKAYRSNIDANVLKNLAGTLVLKDYAEAWLISTGEFGKEAKGFEAEWQEKPKDVACRLSFYKPEKVISAFTSARVIKSAPTEAAVELVGDENLLGSWIFLITPYGEFWAVSTLSGGMPEGVLLFYANNGKRVLDKELLKNISETDTSIRDLNFLVAMSERDRGSSPKGKIIDVVQVQYGDSWNDYRPARPEDFVGRLKDQNRIFDLLKMVRDKETNTRIFAVTGDSGMGKSSLVAKLVSKSRNVRNKNKFYAFAVDVRAATSKDYVYSSLLACLKEAQRAGFGNEEIDIRITDYENPFGSDEIKAFLQSVEDQGKIICLIFDQFEELYSKPELFEVFEMARKLFLAVAAFGGAIVLGFSWKSDSTTHSDHPAYFLWHQLEDLRLTIKLQPFSEADSNTAFNVFEKVVGQRLHNDLRHNVITSSQGYPWLLKKLCIHVNEKIAAGVDQKQLLENKLDIGKLFDDDLKQLSVAEKACLEMVASRAPIDMSEVIEVFGVTELHALVNKRLVVKSGDRLNIYWDIFREYILTKRVPIIPLRYLPTTDFSSVCKVAEHLSHSEALSCPDLARRSGLSEGTIMNIGYDLVMFGIANRENGWYLLDNELPASDRTHILRRAREKFKKHVFTLMLQSRASNSGLSLDEVIGLLKEIFPSGVYAEKTWHSYTVRLLRWLSLCGLAGQKSSLWMYRDIGDINISFMRNRGYGRKGKVFSAASSPAVTIEALDWLCARGGINKDEQLPKGYRNALSVLGRFELVAPVGNRITPNLDKLKKYRSSMEAVWTEASLEPLIEHCSKVMSVGIVGTRRELASYVNQKYGLDWTETSEIRNGTALKQWVTWVMEGKSASKLSSPPGRSESKLTTRLFA